MKIKLTEERNQLGDVRWKVSVNGRPQHNYWMGVDCGPSTFTSPRRALRAVLKSVRVRKATMWAVSDD